MGHEFFSRCQTQPEQIEWIRSRMLPCPFCGGTGESLTVHLPDRFGYAEIGCRDLACCQPRACKKHLPDCLEQWNMRPRPAEPGTDAAPPNTEQGRG